MLFSIVSRVGTLVAHNSQTLGSLVPATAPITLGALHRLEGGGEDKGLAVEEMGVIKHVPGTTSDWSSPWFHLEG